MRVCTGAGRDKTMRRLIFANILIVCSSFVTLAQDDMSSLKWHRWEEGVRKAHDSGKFLLVDVYTKGHEWRKRMDQLVYIHPRVQELIAAQFIPTKLDAESEAVIANGTNHYIERECAKLLNVNSCPTTLVFNSNFQLVARLNGSTNADTFIRFLYYVSGKYYKRYSFEQYLIQVPSED
jgi:thioredoxin-related protein